MEILAMSQGYPERYRHKLQSRDGVRFDNFDKQLSPKPHGADDDLNALREENAQLRDLVVRLSRIVARNVLDRK
jgi:hypothetical protein